MTTIITGSASGMGAAVRQRLEQSGDKVIGIDLRNAEIIANLSTKEGRDAAIAEVKKRCDHIDRFVAAAGVIGTAKSDLSVIIAVDYFGVVDLLDSFLDLLRKGKNPAAVVVSSNSAGHMVCAEGYKDHPLLTAMLDHNEVEAGRQANALSDPVDFLGTPQPRGGVVYMAAKTAVALAVRQRVFPWSEAGVRLNCVCPGMTLTPMLQQTLNDPKTAESMKMIPIPMKRFGKPEELAAGITFLLSNEASYIHGAVLFIDGGMDAAVSPQRF